MWERKGLAGTLGIENIATVPAVVLAVHEAKCRPASHADVRVDPFGRLNVKRKLVSGLHTEIKKTYCVAFQHSTCYFCLWGELKPFDLQLAIGFAKVH